MPLVDLNGTLGESFGTWQKGMDEAMLRIVSSASMACGMHAGDPLVMQTTVASARRVGACIGAEIGYPDLQGYGQRDLSMNPYEIYVYSLYQIGALTAMCRANGVRLDYVKPHGALYRRACQELAVAKSIARAIRDTDKDVILVGALGSVVEEAAAGNGIPFVGEVFADRGYREDGTLIPKGERGDVVSNPAIAAERVLRLLQQSTPSVENTSDGTKPLTIGIHGDYPNATKVAFAVKEALEVNGFTIAGLRSLVYITNTLDKEQAP
ncbi:MAG: 5-oxoprolinase subunit PxpA [Synergistaceae bacterium]|jgi:UPF0271 protein|nr:5-oxoprolinase subunit PxpA [Synergistaceae bacterium]